MRRTDRQADRQAPDRWTARRVLGAVAAATACLLALPAPALAHTELVSTSPVQTTPVAITTDRLVLVFTDELLPGASDVVVHDPEGAEVSVAGVGTLGDTLEVPVALHVPGRHEVAYRVVGQDGHVVSGSWWFTAVAGDTPPSPAAAVSRDRPPGAAVTTAAPGGTAWVAALALGVALTVALLLHRAAPARPGADVPCAPAPDDRGQAASRRVRNSSRPSRRVATSRTQPSSR